LTIKVRKINSIIFVLIVLCFGFSPRSQADPYHYNNMLIGERATGLGGAYTAIADDPSGLYYNPAGIVYSLGSKLSGSMNAFYHVKKRYEKALGNNDWERSCATLLPNFFGVIQPISGGKFGFSYALTDAMIEDQDQIFSNILTDIMSIEDPNYPSRAQSDIVINFNNEDRTYNFGPSYAWKISKNLAVGTTLYIHNRRKQKILNQYFTLEQGDGRRLQENEYYELTEWGLKPIIGLMWSPEEMKYSFGVSISHTFLFDSKTELQFSRLGSGPMNVFDSDPNSSGELIKLGIVTSSTNEKREYPYIFTFGAAYFPSPSLLFSADISYYTETACTISEKMEERRPFVNLSLGTEYYFTNSMALRAGAFTDLASTYAIKKGVAEQGEHVDMYGGGVNLSYFTKGSTLTVGILYKYGTGKAQIKGGEEIQDTSISTLMGYMGASYSF